VFFAISVIPMTIMWIREMMPTMDDVKWMMILGGYLSKVKRPIPAGKFNAGQKMWFWVCTFGGILMILTGAAMYFQDFTLPVLATYGITQIDFLRACAIIHNVMGMAVAALFFTHVYMSMFAIKGAIHSMISGYKEEEEIEILHSSYYKKLKEQKQL
jgi:formate dehydrogenase subunit gamma